MRSQVLPAAGRLERGVGTALLRLVGVLLVATVAVVLVDPRDPNVVFVRPLVVLGLLLSAGAAAGAVVVRRAVRGRVRPRRRGALWAWVTATLVALLGGAGGAWAARGLEYVYGWDAGVMARFSAELQTSPVLSTYAADYLSRYSNNIPLLAVLNGSRATATWAGTTMEMVFVSLNGACVAIALLAAYALVRMVRGHAAGMCAQLVLLLLLAASPWLAVPYTDVLVVPFVTGGLLLAVAAVRARRWWTLVASGLGAVVVLSVGFTLKNTVAPALVALALVTVLVALGRAGAGVRSVAAGAALLATAAAVFVGTTAATGAAAYGGARVDPSQLVADKAPPVSWWVAMGLSTTPTDDGRTFYGSYDGEMVQESMTLSGAALQTYSDQALRDRVARLGPGGLAGFAVDKQAFTWGDGMFFAWGEGRDAEPRRLFRHDDTSRWIQSWNHVSGSHYLTRASLTTGVWLFVLLWAGLGLLGARYRREVLLLALTVLALGGFTLLIQSRSKYLLGYLPVVVALAAVVDPRALLRLASTSWLVRSSRSSRRSPSSEPA